MNGLIWNLKRTFKAAYPDVGNIDQVHPDDGIFWGNVPMNLWYLLDFLKEAKESGK